MKGICVCKNTCLLTYRHIRNTFKNFLRSSQNNLKTLIAMQDTGAMNVDNSSMFQTSVSNQTVPVPLVCKDAIFLYELQKYYI